MKLGNIPKDNKGHGHARWRLAGYAVLVWLEWEDVVRDKPLKTGTQRITMALNLLKGRAKELFQEALNFCQTDESTKKLKFKDTKIFTLDWHSTIQEDISFLQKERINANMITCYGT